MAAVFPLHFHAREARGHLSAASSRRRRTRQKSEASQLGLLDVHDLEKRLSTAFLARYGAEVGREVTSETLAWAWEHRDRLEGMENPAGYLFRVGQSKSRRLLRWSRESVRYPSENTDDQQPWVEPGLANALALLDEEQRTTVVLVHCFQWTYREVAELMDLELHGVRNRVHRGMARLRTELGAAS